MVKYKFQLVDRHVFLQILTLPQVSVKLIFLFSLICLTFDTAVYYFKCQICYLLFLSWQIFVDG